MKLEMKGLLSPHGKTGLVNEKNNLLQIHFMLIIQYLRPKNKFMLKHIFLLSSFFFFWLVANSQKPFEFGGEYIKMFGKGYNSTKAGARAERFSNKNSFSIGITYQLASKKAYSVSSGFGIYGGYRYAFNNDINDNSLFAGARFLLSFENFAGKSRDNSIMITPMGEFGYHFIFGKHLYTAPSLGFGYTVEFTHGNNSLDEDRGGRVIPSLSAGFRF
jgi:hypothetical protein